MKRFVALFLVVLTLLGTCTTALAATRNVDISYINIKDTGRHYMYSQMSTSSSVVREVTGLNFVQFAFLTNGNPYWANAMYETSSGTWSGYVLLSSLDITRVHLRNMFFTNYTLQAGDHGTAIMWLQTYLNVLAYNAGSVDGIWGSNTTNAVRQFQEDKGLSVDGLVGNSTTDKLFEETRIIEYANDY